MFTMLKLSKIESLISEIVYRKRLKVLSKQTEIYLHAIQQLNFCPTTIGLRSLLSPQHLDE